MKSNHLNHESSWQKAVADLKTRLDIDYRNQVRLRDPWARAAHCMAQTWRIIESQGRLGHIPQPRKRLATWNEAALSMKASLYSRSRSRLLDDTTWQFWAHHVPRVHLRYVKKSERTTVLRTES
jgi:hypothetical protein